MHIGKDDWKIVRKSYITEIKEFEDSVFTGKYCDPFVTQDYLKQLEENRKDIKR